MLRMADSLRTQMAVLARQLFQRLRESHAEDRRTNAVLGVWNERSVQASPVRHRLEFGRNRVMVVGTWCPQRDTAGRWRTRLVVALARAATTDNVCLGTTAWLLGIATEGLGWECEVDCDACHETGVCTTAECPRCVWRLEDCAKTNKFVWPELVGRPAWLAVLILKALQPTKRVVLDPFDMLYQTPSNPDVIRVVYDAKSGLVVSPAPHNTASPEVSGPRDVCFLAPEGLCLGAPPNPPPPEWASLVGQRVGGVVAWLKARHPHAVIVPAPSNALITRDWRHDRIRVRYDSASMQVVSTPTVG